MAIDSRHRFTVLKLNDSPVAIGQIHSLPLIHNVNGKYVTPIYYDRYNISYVSNGP